MMSHFSRLTFVFMLLAQLQGCIEEVVDPAEKSAAEALAKAALLTPSRYRIHISDQSKAPKLFDGWCPAEDLSVQPILVARRTYIFKVECGSTVPFEFRVDFKSPPPLLCVDPLSSSGDRAK